MMNTLSPGSSAQLHERKMALLEMRMNAPQNLGMQTSPAKEISPTENMNQNTDIKVNSSSVSAQCAEPPVILPVKIEYSNDCAVSAAASNNNQILRTADDAPLCGKRSACNDCSNDEGESHLSDNGRHGKYSRTSDESTMEPVISVNNHDGSRGSGPKQITLRAYFLPQETSSASATHSITSPTGSNQATVSTTNSIQDTTSPPKEQVHPNQTNSIKKEKPVPKPSFKSSSSSNSATSQAPSATPSNTNVQQLQNTVQELKRQCDQLKSQKDQSDSKATRLENEVICIQESLKLKDERNSKLCKYLEQVYREMAIHDARRKRDKLALDSVRLGKITSIRGGPSFNTVSEVWEEGYAVKELNKRFAEHLERREELEKRKKKLTAMKRQAKKNTATVASASATATAIGNSLVANSSVVNASVSVEEDDGEFDLDLMAETEAIRFHQEQLKREELGLSEEKKLLDSEKAVHQKELKRCQSEERSRFYRDLPCLNNRYLLISMLGRGGFSEVWKALDLQDLKEVAVKVHQLNPVWTEERKGSYIKHVTREYTIHRDLKHPRVVQLFDVFEIDVNSFATVLEYCKGIDLDEKLKRQRTIHEKEARTIILQILSGLKYLNTPSVPTPAESTSTSTSEENGSDHVPAITNAPPSGRRKAVIHFDLKPANILFDEMGDAKITDFGLSKIIDDVDDNTSMELTSQGAGTYWYLPPECFSKDGTPRISSKVDVWSLGVIFYQMLYGKRPFGEGKSQERVLSEGIILNANRVEFPADPKGSKISEEAKDLIRACLTADQRLRPDVFALCQHAFFRNSK